MPINVAEFHVIGNIGKINKREKVAYVSVATNNNWLENGEWNEETGWNSIVCFQNLLSQVERAAVGDLVRVTGAPRETKYDDGGSEKYRTELIARTFSVMLRGGSEEK